jgi:NTE family protein
MSLVKGNIRIGYALGGGAARGLSHIGVLKVLHKHGISPDIIAGTSIGAIIGALYAGGLDPNEIEQLVLGLNWKKLVYLVDMTLPLNGLVQGKRVVSLLKSILGETTFAQLRFDFACVATDIISGEQVVLRDGSLIEAVRASISIPGVLTPVAIKGRYLVDGGLVNTVPVSVCREMGAQYVIGVNVIPQPIKVMCSPNKNQQFQICDLTKLKEIGEGIEFAKISTRGHRSLKSRIYDVENATKRFLISHRSTEKGKILESTIKIKENKVRRSQTKSPKLIDVLSQSLTISEYHLAEENLKDADLAISPDVEGIGFWQFHSAAQAIAAGEYAARKMLDKNKVAILLGNS